MLSSILSLAAFSSHLAGSLLLLLLRHLQSSGFIGFGGVGNMRTPNKIKECRELGGRDNR
jgi:hypothetical protein